jgi:hypothetical protein
MLQRLLERGKTSGREDDNVESIKKRFGELDSVYLGRSQLSKLGSDSDAQKDHDACH